MNTLIEVVRHTSEALSRAGVSFALVCGLAVSARAEPRFTRDVDLAVAVLGDRYARAPVAELLFERRKRRRQFAFVDDRVEFTDTAGLRPAKSTAECHVTISTVRRERRGRAVSDARGLCSEVRH